MHCRIHWRHEYYLIFKTLSVKGVNHPTKRFYLENCSKDKRIWSNKEAIIINADGFN